MIILLVRLAGLRVETTMAITIETFLTAMKAGGWVVTYAPMFGSELEGYRVSGDHRTSEGIKVTFVPGRARGMVTVSGFYHRTHAGVKGYRAATAAAALMVVTAPNV